MTDSLAELTREILAFRDERDWGQFHTPRQLAAALSIEAAELQELFLWKTDLEANEIVHDNQRLSQLRNEIGDVLICALLIAAATQTDPGSAIRQKLALNALRYPVAASKGRATKYSDLPHARGSD